MGNAHFAPAKGLIDDGEFWGAGSLLPSRMRLHEWAQIEALTRKTVAAARHRHLLPYQGKNFKDVLRLADTHGPDHHTPVGATPLMLAAAAGNAALVEALLAKGADAGLRDEFGHTAWDHAVSRAMQDADFARVGLAAVSDPLAPPAIDVQTAGRLVRLDRSQGEYWVLMLMLAGLKTQWSRCVTRRRELWKYHQGFFADQLHDVLVALPAWLWPDQRRKRTYVNQVLARAERGSTYRPARKLWVRARNGYYLPNPEMQLRVGDRWVPVYEALALDWIDQGCGRDVLYGISPTNIVKQVSEPVVL